MSAENLFGVCTFCTLCTIILERLDGIAFDSAGFCGVWLNDNVSVDRGRFDGVELVDGWFCSAAVAAFNGDAVAKSTELYDKS